MVPAIVFLHLFLCLCCQDGLESKLSSRGDSAVSKGTTDSGVVMDNSEIPGEIPGAVPRTLPPLTSESVRASEVDRIIQDGEYITQPDSSCCREIPGPKTLVVYLFIVCFFLSDMLLRDSEATKRQKSSVILEELLNQGIIPKEQPREKGSRTGEAYSITVNI